MHLEFREVYCPAHFGNSYEAMWPREMAAYLDEMQYWGCNRYGDWMTTTDICNPYSSDMTWNLAMENLSRKKMSFRHATKLGLANNLILTPNHVYLDQLRPDLLAQKEARIFGQLLCPSVPEARDIILANHNQQFRDMAQSGIELSAFTAFAYDYGGCACEKCAPWILTFANLVRDIHGVARRYFPNIEPWMCAWWWTPEEYRLLTNWAAGQSAGAPRSGPGNENTNVNGDGASDGWLKAIVFHIPYGQTGFHETTVPAGCRKLGFIHPGYGNGANTAIDNGVGRDIYAKFGAVIAPQRLPATLETIAAQGGQGFQMYSEGVFDDINKIICAALASGRASSVEDVLQEYAIRYFKVPALDAVRWAQWMMQWGERKNVELAAARREFEELATHAQPDPYTNWRLEHWRSKLQLEELDRTLTQSPAPWGAEQLAIAEAFWSAREHLHRRVYGLGPIRHIFAQHLFAPEWYERWQEATASTTTREEVSAEA